MLQRAETAKIIGSVFSAPVNFYGKVEDQYGNPVPGAKVTYSLADSFGAPSSKRTVTSDDRGLFSLVGVRGAGVFVSVAKQGYAEINKQSSGNFSFGMPYDPQRDRPTPTKEKPAVFVLRKKAKAEPMVAVNRSTLIPRDGTPVEVSLSTGRPVAAGSGDLKIEYWTADGQKDANRRYDWHCRFSVPGGGLVKRGSQLAQEAPIDGYQPYAEVWMPATTPAWTETFDENYFLKLGNGNYARAHLIMVAGGDHFVSIIAYLNPSGSRNLEYDAKQDVTMQYSP
ncbi:MAG TPA: carboxypeptidase-like regulatory domain-containing protein [Chryseolinea sp.]